MRKTRTMTIGEIITELETIKDKKKNIVFDFCGLPPEDFDSSRGNYSELAIGYGYDSVSVETLLKRCYEALECTFYGYKGGDYEMKRSTPVWVDNYSFWTCTGIVGFIDDAFGIIIETQYIGV